MGWKVLFWVFIAKCVTVVALLFANIGLMPDEAQYWTWSKALSYGYYSKPAGIAWQIAFGTHFFGDTELGVRFGSVLLSLLLSLSIYLLCKNSGASEKSSFWAAIAFAFCPLGIISGFLATTDCAYILFWTLACAVFVSDLEQKREISFYRLALVIGVGALWKWPIYAIWIPIFIFSPTKKTVAGFFLSLLGLLPSLFWNIFRDFSTFRHVFTSINPAVASTPNPGSFIAGQVALLSPLLFFLLFISSLRFVIGYKKRSNATRFCLVTTAVFLGVVLTMSFFEKVQANWAIASFPTLFAVLALTLDQTKKWLLWTKASVAVSVVLILIIFYLPHTNVSLSKNPWKEGLGWGKIDPTLQEYGYKADSDFLFSDRYQMTSIASFYGPNQKRAYFFNTKGLRRNQFSYWPGMPEECLGKTGYFLEVVVNRNPKEAALGFQKMLEPYFLRVIVLPEVLIAGSLVSDSNYHGSKFLILLRCEGYTGKVPDQTNKY